LNHRCFISNHRCFISNHRCFVLNHRCFVLNHRCFVFEYRGSVFDGFLTKTSSGPRHRVGETRQRGRQLLDLGAGYPVQLAGEHAANGRLLLVCRYSNISDGKVESEADEVRLRLNLDDKGRTHPTLNHPHKFDHLVGGTPTPVDHRQRVFGGEADVAVDEAFVESRVLD